MQGGLYSMSDMYPNMGTMQTISEKAIPEDEIQDTDTTVEQTSVHTEVKKASFMKVFLGLILVTVILGVLNT